MDITIKQAIILILFITFPAIIHSKNSCPNSRCGSSYVPIYYPFKLETDQPPKNCYNSINLRCDDQGHTVINLLYFGHFYVSSIDYYNRKIYLTDPENCLARRFMTNFSVSPLSAFSYEKYTFYVCPKNRSTLPFFQIYCLSNSTNATVAVPTTYSTEFVAMYGCKPLVSSMIPIPLWKNYDDSDKFGYLELTWDFPRCEHCELSDDLEKPGESRRKKLAKLINGSTIFIPLAVIFIVFLAIAGCVRLLQGDAGRATTTAGSSVGDDSATDTAAPPSAAAATGGGTEASKVENFSQVVFHGEETPIISCSICLEEYKGADSVRNLAQCGHLFHAQCIDQWLHKNTTCPICRTSLSIL